MRENRTIVEYLAAVQAHLASLGATERDDALAELESLLRVEAERIGEMAAVDAVGDPADYAAGILEALDFDAAADAEGRPVPQGHVLGMPYDFRGASVERIGSRVWNPADPRILMPRMFGVGWTINLGAIAVKLGLIRPDDVGDESYDRIPRVALAMVLVLPVLLVAMALVILLIAWPSLPAELPIHWGVSGHPDDWAPRAWVVGVLLALAILPPLLSYPRLLRRGTPARSRLLAAAALGMAATLAFGIAVVTVADANGGASGNWVLLVVLGMFAVPFLMLYVPLRLGLRAEWRAAVPTNGEGD
ncbi:MAG: DUF1648 domain-containing protein [Coriobacteriia bacterium]|nr:DUF1648 domain-containing protein [Coriobacteriia bacterium]MBN2840532.1 DUF1648 domain-containing protein [Coriobacteriia bacterium]